MKKMASRGKWKKILFFWSFFNRLWRVFINFKAQNKRGYFHSLFPKVKYSY